MLFEDEDDLKSRSTALLQCLILKEACIKNSNESSAESSAERIISQIEESCLDYFYDDFLPNENHNNRSQIKENIEALIEEKKSLNFPDKLTTTLQSERIKDMIITDAKLEIDSKKNEIGARAMIGYIYSNISKKDDATTLDYANRLNSETNVRTPEVFDIFMINLNMAHSRLVTATSFISGNINFGFNCLEKLIKTNFVNNEIPSNSPKPSKMLETLDSLRPRVSI
jgi:hypothetical protein